MTANVTMSAIGQMAVSMRRMIRRTATTIMITDIIMVVMMAIIPAMAVGPAEWKLATSMDRCDGGDAEHQSGALDDGILPCCLRWWLVMEPPRPLSFARAARGIGGGVV